MNDSRSSAVARFRYAHRWFELEGAHPDDHIFRRIVTTRGFYELELLSYLRFVKRALGRPALAIDVGANIGNHAVFFASFLAAHVVAIEPNPAILPILTRNLERNGTRHTVVARAVGADAGSGRLVLPSEAATNVGMTRVVPGGGDVTITTLDVIVDDLRMRGTVRGPVQLLKIDVEGLELEVLRGAVALLQADHPHVLVEAATVTRRHEVAALLSRYGYAEIARLGRHATPLYHFAYRPPPWLRAVARGYLAVDGLQAAPRALARRLRAEWGAR